MSTNIDQTALWLMRYKNLGYSFFNTGTKEKKSKTAWTKYQTQHPTDTEIAQWLTWVPQNYAIVCGEISNLVVFDVDTKNGADASPFLNRGLFEVRTPSGGYHFYTTYNSVFDSTKHKKKKTNNILSFVDVQTNGSIVFAPPSAFIRGPYTITNDVPVGPLPEDLLVDVLGAMEPEQEATEYTPFTPRAIPEMGRPGDVFNALMSWEEVLYPLGWKKVGGTRPDGTQYWVRPGKNVRDGVSASTNYKGYNLFFPFTTHFSELSPKKGYTKFNLYATLNHGGDYRTAARTLVMDNYKKVNGL